MYRKISASPSSSQDQFTTWLMKFVTVLQRKNCTWCAPKHLLDSGQATPYSWAEATHFIPLTPCLCTFRSSAWNAFLCLFRRIKPPYSLRLTQASPFLGNLLFLPGLPLSISFPHSESFLYVTIVTWANHCQGAQHPVSVFLLLSPRSL